MAEIKIYGVLTSATAEGSIIYGSQAIGSFFSVDSRENVKKSIKQLGMIIFDRADQKYYKWTGTVWEETLKEVSIPDSINTVIKPILTLDPAGPGENEPAFKYIYVQDGKYHVWDGALGKSVITGEDVVSLTKIDGASFGEVTFTSTEGQYGYFVTAGTISAVKNTEGFAAPTIQQEGKISVMVNNLPVEYNVYRIEAALAAGSNTLVVS